MWSTTPASVHAVAPEAGAVAGRPHGGHRGVSEGVREQLVARGFPAERCVAIPNGIDLERFPETALLPFAQRAPGIIMAARFARQKDHATLIEATALLRPRA